MATEQAFSELLGTIYEGPLEETPWGDFLSLLKERLGAAVATLVLQPPSDRHRGVMLNAGGDLDQITSYNESHYALDPFIDLPAGEVVSLQEMIPPEELVKTDFYRLSLEPSNLWDILGADMVVPGEIEARLRISRVKGAKSFGETERALLREVLPHLQRAIRIHARLNKSESERALYAGAVEQLAVGSIILDEQGKVINTNRQARQLLESDNGISLSGDELQLATAEESERLREVVNTLLENRRGGETALVEAMRVERPEGEHDLGLVIRPLPESRWSEGKQVPSVVIFISNPAELSAAPVQVITKLFGFTPTEASLAMQLANGLTLEEAASELGMSKNTARTHLRSLFAKTGVSRQTLLVRLILKSVAPLA